MLNPHDITADLPSPRDDEPENLRGDIRDELADHLQCSLRRELLSGAHGNNENAAWQNVLKRFGSPARIALECWLIKMKGKLIMQKISLGISMAAVILCGVLVAMVWKSMEASQQTNASMLETQSKMLDKMDKLVQATLDHQNPGLGGGGLGFGGGNFGPNPAIQQTNNAVKDSQDWIPFKIKLVSGTKDGPPVVGQKVSAKGRFLGTNDVVDTKVTDKDGIADFGIVRADFYGIEINMPWEDSIRLESNRIRVDPGYQQTTIVCPANDDYRKISYTLDVPSDLQKEQLQIYLNPLTTHLYRSEENFKLYSTDLNKTTRNIDGRNWYHRSKFYNRSFGFNSLGEYSIANYGLRDDTNARYVLKSEPIVIDHVIAYIGDMTSVINGQPSSNLRQQLVGPLKNGDGGFSPRGDLPHTNYLFDIEKTILVKLPDVSIALQPDADQKKIELPKEFWDAMRKAVADCKAATKLPEEPIRPRTPAKQNADTKSTNAQDWIPFKIKLVSGTKDGPPVVGQKVSASGHFVGVTKETIERVTGKDGVVDFGISRPDSYGLHIRMPWGETLPPDVNSVRIVPGYQPEVIVCPEREPPQKAPTISLEVPKDLRYEPLVFVFNQKNSIVQTESVGVRVEHPVDGRNWLKTPMRIENPVFNSEGVLSEAIPENNDYFVRDNFVVIKPLELTEEAQAVGSLKTLHVYFGKDLRWYGVTDYMNIHRYLKKDEKEATENQTALLLSQFPNKTRQKLLSFPLPSLLAQKNSALVSQPAQQTTKDKTVKLSDEFWDKLRAGIKEIKEAEEPVRQDPAKQSTATKSTNGQDWIPFKIKLVSGTKDGPPVVNQGVDCKGHFHNQTEEKTLAFYTDKNGVIDYGNVRPDSYILDIHMPWGENFFSTNAVLVAPGFSGEKLIVCPTKSDYSLEKVSLTVPEDLQKESLVFDFNALELTNDPYHWSAKSNRVRTFEETQWYTAKGEFKRCTFNSCGELSQASNQNPKAGEPVRSTFDYTVVLDPFPPFSFEVDGFKPLKSVAVYRAKRLYPFDLTAIIKDPAEKEKLKEMRFSKLIDVNRSIPLNFKHAISELPAIPEIQYDKTKLANKEWKIELPENFWESLRKELKKPPIDEKTLESELAKTNKEKIGLE